MTTSAVQIDIHLYVNSHGKEPRGHGHWWFEILGSQFCYSGPYGRVLQAAKKDARFAYAKLGPCYTPTVTVLP